MTPLSEDSGLVPRSGSGGSLLIEALGVRLKALDEQHGRALAAGVHYRRQAQMILRSLIDQAEGGDEWVSGHDLEVRIGAIVVDALR